MNREEIIKEVCSIRTKNLLIECGTGVGKTKIAIERIRSLEKEPNNVKVLVVIPRLVLIDNWKDEFRKWKYDEMLKNVIFTTYVSLPKKAGHSYDYVIYDEAHHITARCAVAIRQITSRYNMLLSATISNDQIHRIRELFRGIYRYKISLKTAIDNNILPEPKVILFPLHLDTKDRSYTFRFHTNSRIIKEITFEWYMQNAGIVRDTYKYQYVIHCTQSEWNTIINREIDNLRIALESGMFPWKEKRNRILIKQYGSMRLKFLSEIKTDLIKKILNKIICKRNITFCRSIQQSEELGFSINSKNKESKYNLYKFNNKEINSITSVDCLNEGVNITDCEVGLFATLNVSDIAMKQKQGRILRHKKPKLIIPYYVDTKEEQIVNSMLPTFNKKVTINSIKEIYENLN